MVGFCLRRYGYYLLDIAITDERIFDSVRILCTMRPANKRSVIVSRVRLFRLFDHVLFVDMHGRLNEFLTRTTRQKIAGILRVES